MATLIYYDQSAYNAALQQAAYLAGKFTDLVSQYGSLALPNAAPITTADLPGLLADPYAWLLGRFLGNTPLLLGTVPVNAQKAFESGLVDKPAGFDAFVKAVKDVAAWLISSQSTGQMRQAASFVVAADGTVSFSAAAQAAQQPQYQYYTRNAQQDALLTDLGTVRDAMNRLLATGAVHPSALEGQGFVADALVFSAGQVRVNPTYVLARFNS